MTTNKSKCQCGHSEDSHSHSGAGACFRTGCICYQFIIKPCSEQEKGERRDLKADLKWLDKGQRHTDLSDELLKERGCQTRDVFADKVCDFSYGITFVETSIARKWLERAIKAETLLPTLSSQELLLTPEEICKILCPDDKWCAENGREQCIEGEIKMCKAQLAKVMAWRGK